MAKKTNRYRKKQSSSDSPVKFAQPQVAGAISDNAKNNNADKRVNTAESPDKNRNNSGGNSELYDSTFSYFPPEKRGLWPHDIIRSATQPYRLITRQWRQEIPHMFVVFLLVVILYAVTTPHLVTLEDDGLFIANLEYFGVAHPPGYPVHTFLGGLFYHLLPFGSPAFKGHFFSGFVGAIGCSAIYAAIIMLVRGRVFGYLGGLAYGASRTFWSQAIIAEVYTLNAMFYFIILAMCIRYSAQIGRSGHLHLRLLFIISLLYGIAAANHYPILLLGSTGLFLLVLSQLRNILPNVLKVAGLLLAGLAPPYVWMVWRSFDLTPANFYGPIKSWDQFLFYFTRSGYSGVDKQSGVGLEDKIAFATQLGDDMLWQFTPIGCFFVIIGLAVMLRSRYHWMAISLATSWFTSSALLVILLDFKATFIWLAAFRVYHLLAYGIMAIWLALGAAWTVDRLRFLPPIVRRQIGGVLIIVIVGGSVAAHWEINNRSDYRWAHDLAVAKINSVEANAVLFTFDDLDLPVGYLHYVEKMRPDLTVYNDQGLVYGNRLYSPLIPDHAPASNPNANNKAAVLTQFIGKDNRPIYYHPQRRGLYQHPSFGSDFMGFLRRVNRSGPNDRVVLSEILRQWLNNNVSIGDSITDLWTRQQHYSTVSQLVGAVLLASFHGFELDDSWLEIIDRARENNAQTRILTNSQYLDANKMDNDMMERELAWTGTYDILSEDLLSKQTKSGFYVLRANLIEKLRTDGKDDPDYEAALLKGMGLLKGDGNPALRPLLNLYYHNERYCDFIKLVETNYPDTDKIPANLLRFIRQARQQAVCTPAGDDA